MGSSPSSDMLSEDSSTSDSHSTSLPGSYNEGSVPYYTHSATYVPNFDSFLKKFNNNNQVSIVLQKLIEREAIVAGLQRSKHDDNYSQLLLSNNTNDQQQLLIQENTPKELFDLVKSHSKKNDNDIILLLNQLMNTDFMIELFFGDPCQVQQAPQYPQNNPYYHPQQQQQYQSNKIAVNLVIADIATWGTALGVSWLQQYHQSLHVEPPMGYIHTAIQIGNCFLHLFNDSLVHFTAVKTVVPSSEWLVLPVCSIDEYDSDSITAIVDTCVSVNCRQVNPNTKSSSSYLSSPSSTVGSSADYCMLTSSDVQPSPNSSYEFIMKLFAAMKQSHSLFAAEQIVLMQETIPIAKLLNPYTFALKAFPNHQALDSYVNSYIEKYSTLDESINKSRMQQFAEKEAKLYKLLKIFDRAFWVHQEKLIRMKGCLQVKLTEHRAAIKVQAIQKEIQEIDATIKDKTRCCDECCSPQGYSAVTMMQFPCPFGIYVSLQKLKHRK